ncbi:hypothetical protein [Flavitalea sp.]|nr:hypothetical protein [Flavitalea sp.]
MNQFSNQSRQLALQLIKLVYADTWERLSNSSREPDEMVRAMNSCHPEGYTHSDPVIKKLQHQRIDGGHKLAS